MINHARTLLMNVDGATGLIPELGEEIIPANYRARALPQSLQNIRRVLFGTSPDRAMLNYRCRQLLGLIHGTELEEYVAALDSRITYAFCESDDETLFSDTVFRPSYTQRGGNATDLYIQGEAGSPDTTGRLKRIWDIIITGPGIATITLLRPRQSQDVSFSFSSGLSEPVPLHGSGLSVRLRSDTDLVYRVTSYARPTTDLGDICATLQSVGSETLADLFLTGRPAGAVEPFTTFRQLWQYRRELPYQLGALVLALIYHTDQL